MTIGNNFSAGRNLWLEAITQNGNQFYSPRIGIGENVAVADYVHIGATNLVSLGNKVLLASHVFYIRPPSWQLSRALTASRKANIMSIYWHHPAE
jgi:hypothetical protein